MGVNMGWERDDGVEGGRSEEEGNADRGKGMEAAIGEQEAEVIVLERGSCWRAVHVGSQS